MHPRNPYAERRPDFAALAEENPALKPYVDVSGHEPSIDFTNPAALRALSAALLKSDFDLDVALRDDRLCPTIANRLDYILTCLDLPLPDAPLRVLDIGTGHVAIYALLLHRLRPTAAVFGSEVDDVSLRHAREVLAANKISGTSDSGGITLIEGTASLLSHPVYPLSFTLCNPPFFASESEALASRAAKPEGTSAPTCAANEEVTRGGEVAFVSQMIDESVEHKHECAWFTSLVGKYASLPELVAKVKKVTNNYGVVRLQQRRTARWVLIWGFGNDRLSDAMTRPHFIDPTTSFARLLPPPNSFTVTSPLTAREIAEKVNGVLESVKLEGFKLDKVDAQAEEDAANDTNPDASSDTAVTITLAPTSNTWSRAARRGASTPATNAEALFRADLSVQRTESTSSLTLTWTWGPERGVVDAFWKFLVSKAGLRGEKREREDEAQRDETQRPPRGPGGRGRGRGGRGSFRGRDTCWPRSRDSNIQ